MLDHHLQRTIVYTLAFSGGLRFSELKPDIVDSKLFTYHLKKTIAAGLVIKDDLGTYQLTAEGRRVSTGARDKEQALIVDRAHSVLLLVIRRASDGAWLFYRRLTHPMLGYSGFMHCNPSSTHTATVIAQAECLRKTGLDGEFISLGGGYTRIFNGKNIESFTHFTLLYCNDITGELQQDNDPQAEYRWEASPDFDDTSLFPTTKALYDAYTKGKPFFIEQTYHI